MNLKIAYLYPKDLNLYGDTGNVEILYQRGVKRDLQVEVTLVDSHTKAAGNFLEGINIVFMGGGPDSGQKEMYKDLINNKGPYLKDYILGGGVALFVCGSYQLMGHHYKAANGNILEGLGVFDLYTEHFGHKKSRCVGNIVCLLSKTILQDKAFNSLKSFSEFIVGFENHGGRTFLGKKTNPLAHVLSGHGNNSQDKTEGVHYKNALGTYFHGPLLSKNPHIADYLLMKSLGLEKLSNLDDSIIKTAHSALIKRFK